MAKKVHNKRIGRVKRKRARRTLPSVTKKKIKKKIEKKLRKLKKKLKSSGKKEAKK